MVPDKQPSLAEQLVSAIVGFPKYAYEWIIGLVIAIISDLHITALAVTGVFAGLVFGSVLIGFFAFFVAYSASRVIGNLSNAIGFGLGNINRLSDAIYVTFSQPAQPDPTPPGFEEIVIPQDTAA